MRSERISHAEVSLHPQMAEVRAFLQELVDAGNVGNASRLRVAVAVAPQDPYLVGAQPAQEEGRVRRDEKLCALRLKT